MQQHICGIFSHYEQQQEQGAKEPSHVATTAELYLSSFIMSICSLCSPPAF